eukprot:evm.model.scf_398.1 EVM.evm.TU.scf_398.1   scf_398:7956-9053(+)
MAEVGRRLEEEQAILREVLEYPDGCDLVISAFAAAARHYRRPTVCLPFPSHLFQQRSGGKDYGACWSAVSGIPSVQTLQEGAGLSSCTDTTVGLLSWLLNGKRRRHKLRAASAADFAQSVRLMGDARWQAPRAEERRGTVYDPSLILKVETEGTEHVQGRKALAYHGTHMENVHSILQNGLLSFSGTRLERNGAIYGEGIYLSTDPRVAYMFCKPAQAWPNSALGECLTCLLVCQVTQSGHQNRDENSNR